MNKTRINLHVFHTDSDGHCVYSPLHVGFFPASIAARVVAAVDCRGLAFHSDVPNQIGRVDVVTCDMREPTSANFTMRTEVYTGREMHLAQKESA